MFIIGLAIGAAAALSIYILVRKSALKGKKDEILAQAELEGEKIKNEKILQAKEKFLTLKSEHDKAFNERNNQVREAENRVRQKENAVNQQSNELQRKNKEIDGLKASLALQ